MKFYLKNDKMKKGLLRTLGRIFLLVILFALVPAAYFLPSLLIKGEAADYYCRSIFPWISLLPVAINGMFINSLTELAVVVGTVLAPVLILLFIIKCIRIGLRRDLRHMLRFVYKTLRSLAVLAIIAALLFEVMHGINYNRTSVRKIMHLYGDTRPYSDYAETLEWAYAGMIESRKELGEDYNGVAHMMSSFERAVFDANVAVVSVSEIYDLGLSGNYIHAKAVMLSRLWRYTDIVGAYDPFLAEANVNTDYIDILHFPVTLCHELAHAKGYASETDANTIAVLSCINSERADFRYAGYYYIFMRLWGTVHDYASYEGVAIIDYTSNEQFAAVIRDMQAYNDYNEIFNTGFIADLISRFSEDVNNAFLESNGQEGGTSTYVVPQNAYVEYYCRFVRTDA